MCLWVEVTICLTSSGFLAISSNLEDLCLVTPGEVVLEAALVFLALDLGVFGEEWGVEKGEVVGEGLGEFAGVDVVMRVSLQHLLELSFSL